MKRAIIILLIALAPGLSSRAQDAATSLPPALVLARHIVGAFQGGQSSQLRPELANDEVILEKGAQDFPQDPLIRYALGICYLAQNNGPASLRNMELAYALSRKDPGVGVMYAMVLKMNKQPLKAYEVNKEIVALHPGIPQFEVQLATLDLTIQKYDEALAILEELKAKEPANLERQDKGMIEFMLGSCYLYQGDRTKAIETLQGTLALSPGAPPAVLALGEAYLKNGDLKNATNYLDQILAMNPKMPSALYYKGICYEKSGTADKAKECFEQAYTSGKQYLDDNGQNYYLMFLICQKIAKKTEGSGYKTQAEQLSYSYEAPWKE